jgi:hypothetical protein
MYSFLDRYQVMDVPKIFSNWLSVSKIERSIGARWIGTSVGDHTLREAGLASTYPNCATGKRKFRPDKTTLGRPQANLGPRV